MPYRNTPGKLPLDSPRWRELSPQHSAPQVPRLLRQLQDALSSDGHLLEDAVSALYDLIHHQGDCYETTYAAVPHVVDLADALPASQAPDLWILVGSVAAIYRSSGVPVPVDLIDAFADSLRRTETRCVDLLLEERFDDPSTCLVLALTPVAASGHPVGYVLTSNAVFEDADAECTCPTCNEAFLFALLDDGIATFNLDNPFPEQADRSQPARGAPLRPHGALRATPWSRVADAIGRFEAPRPLLDAWRPELDAAAHQAAYGVADGDARCVFCVVGAIALLGGHPESAARMLRMSGAIRCPSCESEHAIVDVLDDLRVR